MNFCVFVTNQNLHVDRQKKWISQHRFHFQWIKYNFEVKNKKKCRNCRFRTTLSALFLFVQIEQWHDNATIRATHSKWPEQVYTHFAYGKMFFITENGPMAAERWIMQNWTCFGLIFASWIFSDDSTVFPFYFTSTRNFKLNLIKRCVSTLTGGQIQHILFPIQIISSALFCSSDFRCECQSDWKWLCTCLLAFVYLICTTSIFKIDYEFSIHRIANDSKMNFARMSTCICRSFYEKLCNDQTKVKQWNEICDDWFSVMIFRHWFSVRWLFAQFVSFKN